MKKTIVLFVFGLLFFFTAFSGIGLSGALIALAIAALFFFFGWRSLPSKKKQTDKTETSNIPVSPSASPAPSTSPAPVAPQYDFISFKLAGVTFKNGRKSRQSILRAIKFRDGEFADGVELELQPYEYEGQPAYGIFANGQQLGSVPKDMVSIIEENYSRILDFSNIEVYGGGRDENMNTKNYGCEVTLRLKKN